MPKQVGCSVKNCVYNCSLSCNADHIDVKTCTPNNASSSLETECKTFKSK